MLRPIRIAITSGDPDGVGPEVVAKALRKIGPKRNVQFVLWRNSLFPKRDLLRLKKTFKLVTVDNWATALKKIPSSPKELLDICTSTSPGKWVEEAGQACSFKHLDGLATGPLSKPTIREAGLKDIGHTDILKRVSGTQNAYMTFLGAKFNVMLLTGHIPLSQVASKISKEALITGVKEAQKFVALLQKSKGQDLSKKPMGLLGLNPHASDDGLIGNEESQLMKPLIEKWRDEKILVEGPLVPDSAFTPAQWARYSLYIALYHDQGLIPFKAIHGQNGVHLTWGLPFVRTSVDHGTAFDIAGQDKADSTSMQLAIEWAIKLCSGSLV